jgi:hypothetical protein
MSRWPSGWTIPSAPDGWTGLSPPGARLPALWACQTAPVPRPGARSDLTVSGLRGVLDAADRDGLGAHAAGSAPLVLGRRGSAPQLYMSPQVMQGFHVLGLKRDHFLKMLGGRSVVPPSHIYETQLMMFRSQGSNRLNGT